MSCTSPRVPCRKRLVAGRAGRDCRREADSLANSALLWRVVRADPRGVHRHMELYEACVGSSSRDMMPSRLNDLTAGTGLAASVRLPSVNDTPDAHAGRPRLP